MDERINEYRDPGFPDLFRELPTLGSQLECPNCRTEIFSDDINIDKAIAKCHNCHHVFPFEQEIKERRRASKRAEIFQPEGIEMFRLRSELNIDFKWRNMQSSHWFMVLFTLMWNAIVLPMAMAAIMSGETIALLFMSAHILVGVGLLFNLLSNFINKTYITVDEHNLTIEHRPIRTPFYPNKTIPVRDIDQLYVKKYVASRTNGNPNYAYSINLMEKKRKGELKLIKGLKNPDKALFIEQEIEYFLGIKDREVRGEI